LTTAFQAAGIRHDFEPAGRVGLGATDRPAERGHHPVLRQHRLDLDLVLGEGVEEGLPAGDDGVAAGMDGAVASTNVWSSVINCARRFTSRALIAATNSFIRRSASSSAAIVSPYHLMAVSALGAVRCL
jgi:hypothetical protein